MIKAFALTLTLCLGFNAVSWAQDRPAAEAGPRAWQSLAPEQQQLLNKFKDRWDGLPP